MPPSLTPVESCPAPPTRPAAAHKGTFGTVIVVGGSATMIGAPAICAAAALRTGAGLVKLAVPAEILPFAITIEPGATGICLGGDSDGSDAGAADRPLAALDEADPKQEAVLAVGPGLGQAAATGALVTALLHGKRSMVLDADGLNLLAQHGEPRPADGPPLVMTPHPGEFLRLAKPLGITHSPTDPDQRPDAAAALARAHQAVVLLKGMHTIVSDGERYYRNDTGNPALATAGMGDVLTGVIASLIAQGMDLFDAACLGAKVHGLAADQWAQHHGHAGLAAMTLAHQLPDALHALAQH